MFSKPKIFIATDFSQHSDMALLMGKTLLEKCGGSIKLIHIAYPPVWDWLYGDLAARYEAGSLEQGLYNSLVNKMSEQMQRCKLNCDSEVIFGDAYQELRKMVENEAADLLVMGHQGAAGLFHLGGLTQKMASSLRAPVLVVNKIDKTEKIAGLIDPVAPAQQVISAAEELSFLLSSELEFDCVVPDVPTMSLSYLPSLTSTFGYSSDEKELIVTKTKEMISKKIDEHSKASMSVEVTKDKIPETLISMMANNKIDLAVMVRHNKGHLEKMLLGSVTRRVLDKFTGNILILPE